MSAPFFCVGCDAYQDRERLLDDSMDDAGQVVKCDVCEPLAEDREAA